MRHPAAARVAPRGSPYFIVLASVGIAAILVAAKLAVHAWGWDRIGSLQLVTALLGGVIFVLAIVLSGVLTDFKESERLVSDVTSTLRRLHADAAMVASGERLEKMRAALCDAADAIVMELRDGSQVRTGRAMAAIDRVDEQLRLCGHESGMSSPIRTLQVNLGALVRAVDRLEMIVETTFLRAGYVFAGFAVAAALAILTFARVEPFATALALHGFAAFLLSGLYLLIYDLDNPFDGTLVVSTEPLEKLAMWLRKAS